MTAVSSAASVTASPAIKLTPATSVMMDTLSLITLALLATSLIAITVNKATYALYVLISIGPKTDSARFVFLPANLATPMEVV